ncbi:unnamed protein product [Eruca vesicaria subsp. sativa]|uniref:Uncharacterized protein n=1 Tax=Eruca vesicaria subsp. sativa TaxID=29727 RepID=A0ABC8JF90_ERUVS|nr:unnamed protein product [Eruca vesicaria subsp. sativa]
MEASIRFSIESQKNPTTKNNYNFTYKERQKSLTCLKQQAGGAREEHTTMEDGDIPWGAVPSKTRNNLQKKKRVLRSRQHCGGDDGNNDYTWMAFDADEGEEI